MPAGRPRKPTEKKRLQGTLRPDRENVDEPQVDDPLGDAPNGMGKTGVAKWNELAAWPWITVADRDTAEEYVHMWLRTQKLRRAVDKMPQAMVGTPEYGRAERAYRENAKMLLQINGKLGLNPSDRSRVKVPKREKKDATKDFLFKPKIA